MRSTSGHGTTSTRKHKVIILTHDKLKKCLASSPRWMRHRDLDLLVADEIEAYKLLDAVSTFGFFKHVLALGDPNQRVPACDFVACELACCKTCGLSV